MRIENVMAETQQILSLNLGDMHARVRSVLMDVSEEVRSSYLATGDDHLDAVLVPGADLMGKKVKSKSLWGLTFEAPISCPVADMRAWFGYRNG
jgi:hypothetical protein